MNFLYVLVTGDFNARSSRWWQNDITNSTGQEIDSLTLSAGYKQMIDRPIHVINNSMSCIDLSIWTNQSVISNYGVYVSIFDKCHHNIIIGEINIRVPLPPVYVREVWGDSQANVEDIKKAISKFNWSKSFENLSVDERVKHLNETLLNIFRNYIPNKKIKYDYRQLSRINDNIRSSLKQRSKLTKIYYKNGLRKSDHIKVLEKSTECTKKIIEDEKNYFLKMTTKLEDSNTAPKPYRIILNHLLYNKKIPAIPSLLVYGSFISDYRKKANLFNNFLLLYIHI